MIASFPAKLHIYSSSFRQNVCVCVHASALLWIRGKRWICEAQRSKLLEEKVEHPIFSCFYYFWMGCIHIWLERDVDNFNNSHTMYEFNVENSENYY